MSGGRFNYTNDSLSSEMFNYLSPSRGQSEFDLADQARRINPLKDRQLSELCWDFLCLSHSFDWMISGDTGEESYEEDLRYFKKKWLKTPPEELVKREVDKTIAELKADLYAEFGITEGVDGE